MRILEKVVSFFLICWYAIFDFKNHKIRSSIIALLILVIIGVYGASFLVKNNSNSEISSIKESAMVTKNSSSIDESTKAKYSSITDELNTNSKLNDSEKSQLEQERDLIRSSEDADYTVVSPGEFQLDKLKILTDQTKTYKVQNDVLNRYSIFTAGETIWLFNNWINNLVGLPKNKFKANLDEIDGNLFINDTYLNDDQKEYLESRCNMIWDHSQLKPRLGDLNIEFVSANDVK